MSIVSSFSRDLQWSQEKTETMLMQNLGGQTKSIMVFSKVAYCSALPPFDHLNASHPLQPGESNALVLRFYENTHFANKWYEGERLDTWLNCKKQHTPTCSGAQQPYSQVFLYGSPIRALGLFLLRTFDRPKGNSIISQLQQMKYNLYCLHL